MRLNIWDCDAASREGFKNKQCSGLLGVQYRMVKAVRERELNLDVWFGGPKEKSGKNKSVE